MPALEQAQMRLAPLEIYILECFRDHRSAQLPLSEIVGNSTANRYAALTDALWTLEFRHGMLRRTGKKDRFELTKLGEEYAAMLASNGTSIPSSGLAMQRWMTDLKQTVKWKGSTYRVRVIGAERGDGTWEGRLEFRHGTAGPLRTGEETSQPNREALEFWVTGLEPVYLEGALQRAFEATKK